MPDTKSELNDIILNKSGSSFNGFKKVLLAVASFAVLLIIVVVVMSSINGTKTDLSQTILPPEPRSDTENRSELFKSVEITQEKNDGELKRLEAIANDIKQQTLSQSVEPQTAGDDVVVVPDDVTSIKDPYTKPESTQEKVAEPKKAAVIKQKKKTVVTTPVQVRKGNWYVQIGSFARLEPHKKLIAKIKRLGFSYKQHSTTVKGKSMTKLLIGPYETYKLARKAKKKVVVEIEPTAFIYQVVQ